MGAGAFRHFPILLLALCVGNVSCSVKEDRDVCPCLLNLNFEQGTWPSDGTAAVSVFSEEEVFYDECINTSDIYAGMTVAVPRCSMHVRAWAGAQGYISEEGIVIPYGSDCPRVYMHDSDVVARGEKYEEDVLMHKNHSVVTIVFDDGNAEGLALTVIGNVSGYDRYGRPLEGEFSYRMEEDGQEEFHQVILPRQSDPSLVLKVDGHGDEPRYFSLGQYLASSGYDWTSADLEDVTVKLDYALTEISLTIGDWDKEYRYEVEI